MHRRRRISIHFLLVAFLTILIGITAAQAHPSGQPGTATTQPNGSGGSDPIPMRVDSLHPCIMVNDADLGVIPPGKQVTVRLHICNSGQGQISFVSPYATVNGAELSIAASDLVTLKNTTIGPNQCVDLPVTFTSSATGIYHEMVRVWASTRECRDTAIISATVSKPGPFISGHDWGTQWVTTLNPCTRDTAAQYIANVYALNTGGIDFTVAKVELVGKDADDGYFTLDRSGTGTSIPPGTMIKGGDTIRYRPLQRVIFTPKDEREYSCKIRLITTDVPPDTVVGTLHGVGIETHLKTTPFSFDTVKFALPGGTIINRTVTLTIPPTRALTITGLTINGPDAAEFSVGSGVVLPLTVQPGLILSIPITFTPTSQGAKSAQLLITGDQSKCDDSLVTLAAFAVATATVAQEEATARAERIEPNPFSATTTIRFTLPAAAGTTVEIYDAAGYRVAMLADGYLESGEHRFTWDPRGLPSGIYYCRIHSGAWNSSRPVMLVR